MGRSFLSFQDGVSRDATVKGDLSLGFDEGCDILVSTSASKHTPDFQKKATKLERLFL